MKFFNILKNTIAKNIFAALKNIFIRITKSAIHIEQTGPQANKYIALIYLIVDGIRSIFVRHPRDNAWLAGVAFQGEGTLVRPERRELVGHRKILIGHPIAQSTSSRWPHHATLTTHSRKDRNVLKK